MENLVDVLFNKRKPFTPISVPGGSSNGYLNTLSKQHFGPRLQASEKELLEDDVEISRQELKRNLESVGQFVNSSETHDVDIYEKYKFDRRSPNAMQLPIYASKNEIMANIAQCPTVVIEGSTGCGKSTQVRHILRHFFETEYLK